MSGGFFAENWQSCGSQSGLKDLTTLDASCMIHEKRYTIAEEIRASGTLTCRHRPRWLGVPLSFAQKISLFQARHAQISD